MPEVRVGGGEVDEMIRSELDHELTGTLLDAQGPTAKLVCTCGGWETSVSHPRDNWQQEAPFVRLKRLIEECRKAFDLHVLFALALDPTHFWNDDELADMATKFGIGAW